MLESITRSERVIIVEDDGIRSVIIGPRQRLRPAFFVALACVGTALALLGWGMTAARLAEAHRTAAFLEQGAESLAAQLDDSRRQISALSGVLDQARGSLGQALADSGSMTERLAAADQSLRAVDSMTRDAAARRAQAALAAIDQLASQPLIPSDSVPERTSGLALALAEAQAESARLRSETGSARDERDGMAAKVDAVERQMEAMAEGQVALLSRLSEHADLRIGAIETALKDTGINLDRVLRELERGRFGMGGPLVPLPQALPPQAEQAMAQLEAKLDRQARLRALHELLPLSAPVDDFYVSSGFGGRRDPMTNQWARHDGLDLVARLGTPVMATAPGKVVEVGWDEGYGRSVIVDHGFGIRTRYAHLEKATVKEGDALAYGQVLGALGNSGRSSGPHVHYEVLIDGKPVDPLRFMEKGRHVCEG
ncbi:M23 family metallopeptidase [Oleisolibacter albus]|uniref:M23 family metallopeptidase n=1 Tax=Oleisolibacter albus TaxID=2171757 RepID=UPI000DF2A709|nr:M23 family metallopeptidase [Oleisolibacter albus]